MEDGLVEDRVFFDIDIGVLNVCKGFFDTDFGVLKVCKRFFGGFKYFSII